MTKLPRRDVIEAQIAIAIEDHNPSIPADDLDDVRGGAGPRRITPMYGAPFRRDLPDVPAPIRRRRDPRIITPMYGVPSPEM